MDKILDRYNLLRQNCEEIENVNSKEIEDIIKNLSPKKNTGLEGFAGEFYQTFKEELISNLLKLLQQMEEEGTLPKSLYEANLNQTRILQQKKIRDQYL